MSARKFGAQLEPSEWMRRAALSGPDHSSANVTVDRYRLLACADILDAARESSRVWEEQHKSIVRAIELHQRTEAEYAVETARLRAINAELLAAVEKAASECDLCGGSAKVYRTLGPTPERCPACADLRALIARARGEP